MAPGKTAIAAGRAHRWLRRNQGRLPQSSAQTAPPIGLETAYLARNRPFPAIPRVGTGMPVYARFWPLPGVATPAPHRCASRRTASSARSAGPRGKCDVPAPNSFFVAVSACSDHSLGLKADGSIVAWGSNSYGQCDVSAPNSGYIDCFLLSNKSPPNAAIANVAGSGTGWE
jgi:hypothetical protein